MTLIFHGLEKMNTSHKKVTFQKASGNLCFSKKSSVSSNLQTFCDAINIDCCNFHDLFYLSLTMIHSLKHGFIKPTMDNGYSLFNNLLILKHDIWTLRVITCYRCMWQYEFGLQKRWEFTNTHGIKPQVLYREMNLSVHLPSLTPFTNILNKTIKEC